MLHLKTKFRNPKDKKAKTLLREGYVPGIVYGPKMEPTPVLVEEGRFVKVYKKAGETTLITLDFIEDEGSKNESSEDQTVKDEVVLIRDVQTHPVKRKFLHVDFYQLPMDQPIEISVPILPTNEAPAVKEHAGILVHNLHEVNIKALPKKLIHEIVIDLSVLENIGDSILVKDLSVPEDIEILAEPEETVFTVEAPREEEPEEVEEEEAAEEGQLDDIKTEGEEKREEREAKEAEEGGEEKPEAKPEEKQQE